MCLVGEEGKPAALAVEVISAGSRSAAGSSDGPSGEETAVSVASAAPLAAARTAALTAAKARDALGALGGTPYRLGELEFAVADGLFLAVGELKELRRRAVAAIDEHRLVARRRGSIAVGRTVRVAPSRPERTAAAVETEANAGVVLVLRPGEHPLSAPGVVALGLDLQTSDAPAAIAAAAEGLRAGGLPLRARLPEVVFDGDAAWLRDVLAVRWDGLYVRQLGVLSDAPADAALIIEYPLQGLNALTAGAAAAVAGRPPAAVVVSPEASLEDIVELGAALAAGPSHVDPPPALEALAFGRQQVLRARDQLGRAEGLYEAPGPAAHVGLLLEDAKGYEFPVDVDSGGTRLFNARVTNLAANLDELRAAGVTTFLVVQSDLDDDERRAFAADGLPALAPLASRERSTSGHLFRGVP
jgi:putative protease